MGAALTPRTTDVHYRVEVRRGRYAVIRVTTLERRVHTFADQTDAQACVETLIALNGRVPFGFRLVAGELRPDPRHHPTVVALYKWADEGRGPRAIANRLNKAGMTALRGGKWYPESVRRVLRDRPAIQRGTQPPKGGE